MVLDVDIIGDYFRVAGRRRKMFRSLACYKNAKMSTWVGQCLTMLKLRKKSNALSSAVSKYLDFFRLRFALEKRLG